MKPLRGKRVGSAQSARGIQPGGSGSAVPVCGDPLVGLRPGRARPPPGAFPPSVVRRDRLWVGLEGLGAKVARGSGRLPYSASACTSPFPGAVDQYPLRHLSSGRDGAPRLRRDCQPGRTVLSAHPTASRRPGGDRPTYNWRQGSAAMSATHPTRLETRTKESNACASQRVTPSRNPVAQ